MPFDTAVVPAIVEIKKGMECVPLENIALLEEESTGQREMMDLLDVGQTKIKRIQ